MEKVNFIMLIDDDPVTNFLNTEVIKSLDVAREVRSFTSVGEAISLIKERCDGLNCPEVIFLDINMATGDGFEFLEELHLLNIDTTKMKVIMLSSSNLSRDKSKARDLGASGYLVKPLDEENLLSVVNDLQYQ